jgi:hypothetical protein
LGSAVIDSVGFVIALPGELVMDGRSAAWLRLAGGSRPGEALAAGDADVTAAGAG